MFFEKKVNKSTRKSMVEFLSQHFRYDTAGSWNGASSYANCIKVHRLGLTREQVDSAYDMMETEFWDQISDPIREFTSKMCGAYTIGANGRSGGYLVLYESRRESTGHKSWCRSCGQRNFRKVLQVTPGSPQEAIAKEVLSSQGAWHNKFYLDKESILALEIPEDEKIAIISKFRAEAKDLSLGNRCGVCHAEGERGRVNYENGGPFKLAVYSGRSIDRHEDFDGWSMDALRSRVELVQAFDRACDQIRENFIDLIDDNEVVEEVVMVPTKTKVLRPRD